MCRTLARESPSSTTRGSAFPDWAGLARALVQPSSWRRMGLRWTAAATSMSARCRGPTGRKLSETSHDQIICARCTSSGRWYRRLKRACCPPFLSGNRDSDRARATDRLGACHHSHGRGDLPSYPSKKYWLDCGSQTHRLVFRPRPADPDEEKRFFSPLARENRGFSRNGQKAVCSDV